MLRFEPSTILTFNELIAVEEAIAFYLDRHPDVKTAAMDARAKILQRLEAWRKWSAPKE